MEKNQDALLNPDKSGKQPGGELIQNSAKKESTTEVVNNSKEPVSQQEEQKLPTATTAPAKKITDVPDTDGDKEEIKNVGVTEKSQAVKPLEVSPSPGTESAKK